jgi:hypothetical protein
MGTKFTVSNTGVVTLTNDLIVDTDVLKVDTTNDRVGIGTASPGVLLDVGLAGSILGVLRVAGSTSGNVTIQPAAVAGAWTLTLPTTGGTSNYALTTNGSGVSSWSQISLSDGVTGTLPVDNGGTGLTAGTSGGVLAFTAAGTLASSAELAVNNLVLGGGAGAAPTTLGSLGTATTVLHGNASGAPTFGAVSLTADVSGTLPVANGGTGATTLTSNGVLYGNGTSAVQITSQGAADTVLTANAGAPSFSASPTIGTSVTSPVHIGGSGASSTLSLRSTSGVGTSDAIIMQVGNDGATEALRVTNSGGVGIGTASPDASAILEISSSTRGFRPPVNADPDTNITSPAEAIMAWDTTDKHLRIYDGTAWQAVGSGSGHEVLDEGSPLAQRGKIDFVGTGVTATDGGAGPDSTIVTIPGNTEIREPFVATGGQTLITLATPYVLGDTNLLVFRNGQLQRPGAGNDYTETSTTSFTFEFGLTAGDIIVAYHLEPSTVILQQTPGTPRREPFTATGSPETFTLVTAPYINDGKHLKVFVNGALQKPSVDYSEDNTTQFTFSSGLTSGDNVEAVWVTSVANLVSFTPAVEFSQTFVATGTESGLFTLTGGKTFTQGGDNLKVFVDGVRNVLGGSNDYTEPDNSSVQFNAGNHPTAGQVVRLEAITQVGALGNFQNKLTDRIATAGQTVFDVGFTFVMGGDGLMVFNDGVLMKFGDDYYELNNTQVVFNIGRTLNSKVTFRATIQAAAGDANSVNGISASITPTAGKLVPLDGEGVFPPEAVTYAILAAL